MRKKARRNHAGKTPSERKAYVDSVMRPGPTAASYPERSKVPSDTKNLGEVGEAEPLAETRPHAGDSRPKRPYRSFKTKLAAGIEENLLSILGWIIAAAIGVIGFLFVLQFNSNREIGEMKTKIETAEKGLAEMREEFRDLGEQQTEFDKSIALIQQALGFMGRGQ